MTDELRKQLLVLCEHAAVEQNSERLMQLIREIDCVLTAGKGPTSNDKSRAANVDQSSY